MSTRQMMCERRQHYPCLLHGISWSPSSHRFGVTSVPLFRERRRKFHAETAAKSSPCAVSSRPRFSLCLKWQTCGAHRLSLIQRNQASKKAWDLPVVSRKREELLIVICTNPGWVCPSYCGCCSSSLRRFPARRATFVNRNQTIRHIALRIAVTLRLGSAICAPHTGLRAYSIPVYACHAWPCLPQVCRSSRTPQRRQRSKQGGSVVGEYSIYVGAMLICAETAESGLTAMSWANGRCLVRDFSVRIHWPPAVI
jgi:hypothetical protein